MNICSQNSRDYIVAFAIIPPEILSISQKIHLLKIFNFDIKKILNLTNIELQKLLNKRKICNLKRDNLLKDADNYLDLEKKGKFCILTPENPLFPFLCWKNDDFSIIEEQCLPFLLFCKGDISLFKNAMISIFGTRKPKELALNFTNFLVKSVNKTVVSGFAEGIDARAHISAYENKVPTIAVFGCGINIIYPKSNLYLYSLLEKSRFLIISEYAPDAIPQKYYFPLRNRIIAALSDDLFCIQARWKSGALITVEYGIKYKKRIFTFYPIELEGYEGNKYLFNSGKARLIYCYYDGKYWIKEPGFFNTSSFLDDEISIEQFCQDSKNIISTKEDFIQKFLLKTIFLSPGRSSQYYIEQINSDVSIVFQLISLFISKGYIYIGKDKQIYPDYNRIPIEYLISHD